MFYGVIRNQNPINEGLIGFLKDKKKQKEETKNYSDKWLIKNIIDGLVGKAKPMEMLYQVYERYYIAEQIGICTIKELDEGFTKYCKDHPSKFGVLYLITKCKNFEKAVKNSEFSKETLEEYANKIPGFKENAPICDLAYGDEYLFFYNFTNKSFYYDGVIETSKVSKLANDTSLYKISYIDKKEARKFSKKEIENFKKMYESKEYSNI